MKTLKHLIVLAVFLCFANPAAAAIYKGTWNNQTFSSSGALTIKLVLKTTNVSGFLDLDGPVFGAGDPPAIPFNTGLKADGSGKFAVAGTAIGDIKGSFDAKGNLKIDITNIPGGFLTRASLVGKFNLKLETFEGTYKIFTGDEVYAVGTTKAHVAKEPIIRVAKRVEVSGKTGEVQARVITNTTITSFKATVVSPATVTVTGTNPYVVRLRKLATPSTEVRITVINADGLRSRKTVTFVKTSSSPASLSVD
jgi:hypothetical protein